MGNRTDSPRFQAKKRLLSAGLVLLFGILLLFKYLGLLGVGVALPLGISFYTFQMAAYLIDVTRGQVEPVRRPWDYLAGILMFPKAPVRTSDACWGASKPAGAAEVQPGGV